MFELTLEITKLRNIQWRKWIFFFLYRESLSDTLASKSNAFSTELCHLRSPMSYATYEWRFKFWTFHERFRPFRPEKLRNGHETFRNGNEYWIPRNVGRSETFILYMINVLKSFTSQYEINNVNFLVEI